MKDMNKKTSRKLGFFSELYKARKKPKKHLVIWTWEP